MRTAAVCVGINEYQDAGIANLRFAELDAHRFAATLRSLGVLSTDIFMATGHEAVRQNILRQIRVLLAASDPRIDNVIFYFAGHGSAVSGRSQSSTCVLLTFDCRREDIEGTGISFGDLLGAVGRLEAASVFLVFDACFVDIGDTSPLSLLGNNERELLDSLRPPSIVCLAAAPQQEGFEVELYQGGAFTHHLADALLRVGHGDEPTINKLVDALDEAQSTDAEFLPFSRYIYSTQPYWPLGKHEMQESQPLAIERSAIVSSVRFLAMSSDAKPLFVYGPSGSGKTQVLLHLRRTMSSAVYLSVAPDCSALDALVESIRDAAVTQLGLEDRLWGKDADIRSVLTAISLVYALPVFIFDHAENLAAQLLKEVLYHTELSNTVVIFSSRLRPAPFITCRMFEMPSITLQEATELIATVGPETQITADNLVRRSEGNIKRARGIIDAELIGIKGMLDPTVSETEFQRAGRMLVRTGGCCDVSLFASHFNIEGRFLHRLEDAGWAYRLEGILVPHDQLNEAFGASEDDPLTKPDSVSYWCKELSLYKSPVKARNLVEALYLGTEFSDFVDQYVAVAIDLLFRAQLWIQLRRVSSWVKDSRNDAGALTLLACLKIEAERGQSNEAMITSGLLDAMTLDNQIRCQKQIYDARALWWSGDFDKCIEAACMVKIITDDRITLDRSDLETGIALFFQGKWAQAKERIERIGTQDGLTYAWALMMLSSIDGIRGIEPEESERIMLDANRLLKFHRDWIGLGIGWNNLGELRWKAERYIEAIEALELAEEIARDGGNDTDKLEISRNRLAASMRFYGPKSHEAEHWYQIIQGMRPDQMGLMQKMQVWNTLATYHAYRGELTEAKRVTALAKALTTGNPEYNIYSLGNEGLVALLEKDWARADQKIGEAVELAKRGENFFAVRQVLQDAEYVTRWQGSA